MKALIAGIALLVVVGIGFLLYSSPTAPPAEMTDADRAQIEAEVEQIVLGLYDSVAQGDVGVWMATLHEQTGLWLLGMDVDNFRRTSEGFEALWTSEDETRPVRQEMDNLEVRVVAISPNVAYAQVTSQDRRSYLASGGMNRTASAETWVFVLTEDGWKLHSGQGAFFPLEEEVVSEQE